jgi:hypothetical protein
VILLFNRVSKESFTERTAYEQRTDGEERARVWMSRRMFQAGKNNSKLG